MAEASTAPSQARVRQTATLGETRQGGSTGAPGGRVRFRLARNVPFLAVLLGGATHAVAAAAWVFPLARLESVCSAAVGAMAGAIVGPFLSRRLRALGVGLALVLPFALGALARGTLTGVDAVVSGLGPAAALRLGDAALFGLGCVTASGTLRALSTWRRSFGILEVLAVGLAFAQLVVAHRNHAINRPFSLVDPIIASGGDPTWLFLAVGAMATAAIVSLLLVEGNVFRLALHVGAAAVLLWAALMAARFWIPPGAPATGGGLGLRPDDKPSDSDKQDKGGGSSGTRNNEQLEFRDDYNPSTQDVPVGVVIFHSDYSSPTGVYYLRQGAFSQFNGRRLVTATRAGMDQDIASSFPTDSVTIAGAPPVNAYRAHVDTTVALLADHARPFALESPFRLRPLPNPDAHRFRRVYKASSGALTADLVSMLGAEAGDAGWTEEDWQHYLRAPEDSRYRELAGRVVRDFLRPELLDDPTAKAIAVTQWLSEEGIYSLRSRHAGADDPTASFLFGNKTGYCVHFAHAAVYLMRTQGVPARVATGYMVEESARQGGSALLVSGRNSHAWPEVYLRDFGWVVMDVSPRQALDPPPPPPDADLQRLLGELARGQKPLPQTAEAAIPRLGRALAWLRSMAARALVFGLGLALVWLVLVKVWRRVTPRWAAPRRHGRLMYRACLDRLSELSFSRRRGESREAFAQRIGNIAPSFAAVTETHLGLALGSRRAELQRAMLPAQMRLVRRELQRAIPWWRRALGIATPWSWLWSR